MAVPFNPNAGPGGGPGPNAAPNPAQPGRFARLGNAILNGIDATIAWTSDTAAGRAGRVDTHLTDPAGGAFDRGEGSQAAYQGIAEDTLAKIDSATGDRAYQRANGNTSQTMEVTGFDPAGPAFDRHTDIRFLPQRQAHSTPGRTGGHPAMGGNMYAGDQYSGGPVGRELRRLANLRANNRMNNARGATNRAEVVHQAYGHNVLTSPSTRLPVRVVDAISPAAGQRLRNRFPRLLGNGQVPRLLGGDVGVGRRQERREQRKIERAVGESPDPHDRTDGRFGILHGAEGVMGIPNTRGEGKLPRMRDGEDSIGQFITVRGAFAARREAAHQRRAARARQRIANRP